LNSVLQFIGKDAVYSSKEARFADRVVQNPRFKAVTLAVNDFRAEYHARPLEDFGILTSPVVQIELMDPARPSIPWPGDLLIVRDETHLITLWDTQFLELERKGQPCRATSGN
jgi:hypothetical protein